MSRLKTRAATPQELQERDARNNCLRIFGLAVFFLIAITIILVFGWLGTLEKRRNAILLAEQGQTTTGFIIDKYMRENPHTGDTYHLVYRYQAPRPDGESGVFENDMLVSPSAYNKAYIEQNVTVLYVPDDPSISTLNIPPDDPPSTTFLVILGIISFVLVVPLFTVVALVSYGLIRQRIRGEPITWGRSNN